MLGALVVGEAMAEYAMSEMAMSAVLAMTGNAITVPAKQKKLLPSVTMLHIKYSRQSFLAITAKQTPAMTFWDGLSFWDQQVPGLR